MFLIFFVLWIGALGWVLGEESRVYDTGLTLLNAKKWFDDCSLQTLPIKFDVAMSIASHISAAVPV